MTTYHVYKITHVDRPEPRCCFIGWSSLPHGQVLRAHQHCFAADPSVAPLYQAIRDGLDPEGLRIETLEEGLDAADAWAKAIETVREIGCIEPHGWNFVNLAERDRVAIRQNQIEAAAKKAEYLERYGPPVDGVHGRPCKPVKELTTGLEFESGAKCRAHFKLAAETLSHALQTGAAVRGGLRFEYL